MTEEDPEEKGVREEARESLTIPPDSHYLEKALSFVEAWGEKSGLEGKVLKRFVFAVGEVLEALIFLSKEKGVERPIKLEVNPWKGWLSVKIAFSKKLPLTPTLSQEAESGDLLKGVSPLVFWRKLVEKWVDKALWREDPFGKEVVLTQYARPPGHPGELYFLGLTPRPSPDVSFKMIGDNVALVVNPLGHSAFRMSKEMLFVLEACDGKKEVRDIYRQYVEKFGLVHPLVVGGIVEDLVRKGLLVLGDSLEPGRGKAFWNFSAMYSLPHPDALVGAINNRLGFLWSGKAALFYTFLVVSSLFLFFFYRTAVGFSFAVELKRWWVGWGWWGVLLLFVLMNLHFVFHELSHAVVCKRLGGKVTALGVIWCRGILCPFADTTYAWAFPKVSHRVLVSFAGPFCDLVMSALYFCLYVVFRALSWDNLAVLCVIMSCVLLYGFALNVTPLFETDGYYMLVDITGIPGLRRKALQYVMDFFSGKRGASEREKAEICLKEKVIFVGYLILSLLGGAFVFFLFFKLAWYSAVELKGIWYLLVFFLFVGLIYKMSAGIFRLWCQMQSRAIDLKGNRGW